MLSEPKIINQTDGQQYWALFEMANDGIITIKNNGVIENANQAACNIFGYDKAELLGQQVNILMNDYDRAHHNEYMNHYQSSGVANIIGIGREVIGKRKDGTTFPFRLAVSEIKLADETIFTGIIHDLTSFNSTHQQIEQLNQELQAKIAERTATLQEKEAELQLARNREHELNGLKSRFLNMANHEFKTPLSTMLSSIELIEIYSEPTQRPNRERHFQRIKTAINQLTEVLNDFLTFAQLERGNINLEPRLTNLKALLRTCIEVLSDQLKEGQEINLSFLSEVEHLVTDPNLLQKIITNLVSNSSKYSERFSPISIEVALDEPHFLITVRDQGIGIPEEDQQYLFAPFFRAKNAENIQGVGLGLNIVRHYVDNLNGRIEFDSQLGKGAEFRVYLPCLNGA